MENPVSGSGTFSGNVSCSASGAGDPGGALSTPRLRADLSGEFEVDVPESGLSFSVDGMLSRGETAGRTGEFVNESFLNGEVTVEFVDAAGAAQRVTFRMNDGTSIEPTAAEIPISTGVRLSPPSAIIRWSLSAGCFQEVPKNDGTIDLKRNGSLTLTYGLGH
jgi:hypothetical protein